MLIQIITVGYQCPTIADLMNIPLDNYITITANHCRCGSTAEELILNYIHPFFLKAKSTASQEDNQKSCEVTTGVSADNDLKAMKVDIDNL